jgi:hypothetical protein
MKRIVAAALAGVLTGSLGCYRTHYKNVAPPVVLEPSTTAPKKPRDQSWIHFFIWGWIPAERRIAAAEQCGGPEHIVAIETERRFIQGLIAVFASYYINIYSPWTARVVCDTEIAPPTNENESEIDASNDAAGG